MIGSANIIIVGGGAVGCGVAFQLAEAGITDVLVLEREPQLCAVTSAQAAGLVGQVRSTVERTRLAMWSVATFNRLERASEVRPGWRQTGCGWRRRRSASPSLDDCSRWQPRPGSTPS